MTIQPDTNKVILLYATKVPSVKEEKIPLVIFTPATEKDNVPLSLVPKRGTTKEVFPMCKSSRETGEGEFSQKNYIRGGRV